MPTGKAGSKPYRKPLQEQMERHTAFLPRGQTAQDSPNNALAAYLSTSYEKTPFIRKKRRSYQVPINGLSTQYWHRSRAGARNLSPVLRNRAPNTRKRRTEGSAKHPWSYAFQAQAVFTNQQAVH